MSVLGTFHAARLYARGEKDPIFASQQHLAPHLRSATHPDPKACVAQAQSNTSGDLHFILEDLPIEAAHLDNPRSPRLSFFPRDCVQQQFGLNNWAKSEVLCSR